MVPVFRRPIHPVLVVLAMAVTLLAGVGTGSAQAARAPEQGQPSSCPAARSTTMYIGGGRASDYFYSTSVDSSGAVRTTDPQYVRRDVDTGSAAITVLGCKNEQTGTWYAFSYDVSQVHRDLDLEISGGTVTPRPHVGDEGFGVFIKRVTPTDVEISSTVCAPEPGQLSPAKTMKTVAGLPLPINYGLVVGQWVLQNALPAGPQQAYSCVELGSSYLPWSFTADGTAQLRASERHVHYDRKTWHETACPLMRDCTDTRTWTVEIPAHQS